MIYLCKIIILILIIFNFNNVIYTGRIPENVNNQIFERRYPQAIIIGVKKSGTRALLEFLKINKKIKAPGPEVHYFDKNYNKGLDWYRSQLPEAKSGDIIIEKSPGYFVNPLSPERIYNLDPKMKLILVVRNPIIRAISDYTQAKSRKINTIKNTFEEMVLCNEINKTNCKNGINSSWGAIKIGVYHKYLLNWLKYFPLEQILFIDGENLISNPVEEVNRAEKFLGLSPVVLKKNFIHDPVKGFPCVKYADSHVHCLGKTKGRKHPRVKRAVTEQMKNFYKLENEKFFNLIQKRFNWL